MNVQSQSMAANCGAKRLQDNNCSELQTKPHASPKEEELAPKFSSHKGRLNIKA